MFLYVALEALFIIAVATVLTTQVFIPIFRGTVLWPWFRRERKLEHELHEVQQEIVEKELEEKVEAAKRRARVRAVK